MPRRRRMVLLTLILALTNAWTPSADAAQLQAVEQRVVDIPDTRLISMSPDGRWLVAVKGNEDRPYPRGLLCVYAVATLRERACGDLSTLAAGLRIEDVVWSPDSARLAFAEETFKTLRDGDLWLMDAATGQLTNLDNDRYTGELLRLDDGRAASISLPVSPAFSPDGQRVAFSRSWIDQGVPTGNEIAVVPVTGGPPERLAPVAPDVIGIVYWGIRWAPDASRLYYSVAYPERDHPANGIWVVAADGRERRQLVPADPAQGAPAVVQVSPRGDRLLAFYPDVAIEMAPGAPTFYAVIDATSGAAEPVTLDDPDAGPYPQVSLATFSPDGSRLLYTGRLLGPPDFRVYVRDVDGGPEARLAAGLPGAIGVWFGILPTWAPDGTVFIPAGQTLSSGTLLRLEGNLATPSPTATSG